MSALWCSLCVGGPDIALAEHGERQATAQPVDLRAGGNIVAGCEADPLIRVHGKCRSKNRQMCTIVTIHNMLLVKWVLLGWLLHER